VSSPRSIRSKTASEISQLRIRMRSEQLRSFGNFVIGCGQRNRVRSERSRSFKNFGNFVSVIRSDSDKEIKCLHRVRYVRHESDAFRAASQLRRFCNRMRSEIPDAVRAASQLRKFSETLRPLSDLSPTRKSSVLTEIDTARETGK
jgi:hypothetical protein